MNIEEIYEFCISKPGVTEDFPFDQHTLVFKVCGKVFALCGLERWERGEKSINLKCDPQWAIELRATYQGIVPGYHMNKKHWNTVLIDDQEIRFSFLKELIDHSYNSVVKGLPKKLQQQLSQE